MPRKFLKNGLNVDNYNNVNDLNLKKYVKIPPKGAYSTTHPPIPKCYHDLMVCESEVIGKAHSGGVWLHSPMK